MDIRADFSSFERVLRHLDEVPLTDRLLRGSLGPEALFAIRARSERTR